MKHAVKVLIGIALILGMAFSFAGFSQAGESSKVNLNEATVQDLVKIKGIGQKYAERIVEYREGNGKFEKVEDIMRIKGIGKKKFESMKDLIFVETENNLVKND